MAVAYSNCDKFYVGEVLKEDKNICEIYFLTDLDGDNNKFTKALNPKIETVHRDQVFKENLELQMNGDELSCAQPEEVHKMFFYLQGKVGTKRKDWKGNAYIHKVLILDLNLQNSP